jgi:hypothetical protein
MPDAYTAMLSRRYTRHPVVLHLAVIAFYGLTTVLVLNRLIFNLTTHVSSGPLNDYNQFTWNYWWIGYAINTLHVDPYFTNYVLFPFQHNLTWHTLTPILYPPYALLQAVLGNPATLNVILWASFVLTGYLTFVLLRRWTDNMTAALIGGLLFAFVPGMMDHAINFHANMWLMAWFPAILLLWDEVARTKRLIPALVLGLAFWGLWMTDVQFVVWVPTLLLPFGILTLVRARQPSERLRLIGLGTVSLAVMAALLFIAPLPALLKGDPVGPVSPADYFTTRSYSLPLSALFFFPGTDDRSIGRVIVALTLLAFFVRPNRPIRWFWFAVALVPLILSLGSDIQIGELVIPLPYRLLHGALGGLYRFPSRFAPVGVLALLIFVGLSFRPRRRYLVATVLIPLILLDGHLLAPFPLQEPLPDRAIYHAMRAEKNDYVVLDVPVTAHSGWARVGGDLGQRAMWYQTIHQKRQINGALSRIPDIEHVFWEQPPLLSWFSGTNWFVKPQPLDVAAASRELTRLIREWPVGYVIVHLDWLDPAYSLPILGFLNAHPDLCFVSQEQEIVAYRARVRGCPDLAADDLAIDFGRYGDEPYLIEGWYPREAISGSGARWSRSTARLKFMLKPGQDYDLSLGALAYGEGRRVTVFANDIEITAFDLAEDWTTETVHIPADLIGSTGEVRLTLQANGETSPSARAGSPDTRVFSAAYRSIRVTGAGS